MNVNKGVVSNKSKNLDAKSMTFLQATCKVSDCRIFVTAANK